MLLLLLLLLPFCYRVYTFFFYAAETSSMNESLQNKVDAFDQHCVAVYRLSYRIDNAQVRRLSLCLSTWMNEWMNEWMNGHDLSDAVTVTVLKHKS